jgi:hypothetical protein
MVYQIMLFFSIFLIFRLNCISQSLFSETPELSYHLPYPAACDLAYPLFCLQFPSKTPLFTCNFRQKHRFLLVIFVDKDFYAWQDGRSEVEFVRNIEGDILPIEVKSGNVTHAKSLQKFIEKYKSKYRTIMSGRPFKIDQRNGVHNYPLYLASRFPIGEQK